jgi:hypothetical protein
VHVPLSKFDDQHECGSGLSHTHSLMVLCMLMLPLLTPYHLINSHRTGALATTERGEGEKTFSMHISGSFLFETIFYCTIKKRVDIKGNEKLLSSWKIYLFFSFSFFVYLQGGEVVQETITSNIHDDIITLEFQRTDGTLITQLIDFRSVSN